jgi:Na+/H+ antiporter NhaD/arsenite permease-like protein
MTATLIIFVFLLGYTAIAFEQSLKINKAATALLTGVLCWTIYVVHATSTEIVIEQLMHHLGEISAILFFLLGAMTIVELIDSHNGFEIITRKISTTSKSSLLLILTVITFFLSAVLDNLTTAIVMVSVCAKILTHKEDRLWFAGMIIIAANAGGVWSPLGDVTTTMLWIGGQITAGAMVKFLVLPGIMVALVPALLMSTRFKGKRFVLLPQQQETLKQKTESTIVLFSGVGFLLFVPLFKSVTHLPPFMGMLLALGCMWVINFIIHKNKEPEYAEKFTVARALQRIDAPSILFFLGILLAVSAIQSFGILQMLAASFDAILKNDYVIAIVLGLLSSIVDNVPLVAAAQGMYDLSTFPTDHPFWLLLSLTTGAGGSVLIIGSAAGVAVMGIGQISFLWYLKKISLLALAGFISGVLCFFMQMFLM